MIPFHQTSGIRAANPRPSRMVGGGPLLRNWVGVTSALLTVLLSSGCLYSFQAGAGFPGYVKTVAIIPFDLGQNVSRPELADEIFRELLREFPRSQGLQPAGEDVADAVVRGTIKSYQLSTPSYRAGAAGEIPQVLQRQVTITVEVKILNQVDNVVLWESLNVSGRGEYLEESETEDVGRALAIELIIQQIVDGAQSNW